ncbi:MAG: dihydroorotase [Steroidobacteraceae bacterium]|jgi:dihydroorotase|nr:dihydroorotase [Steroidobacteraceae bacterium]
MNPDSITIGRPDDWHLHLRDGAALRAVLPHTAERFARAIVMPNLKPPVTTTVLAGEYRQRILDARPDGSDFEPLMTLYLTDRTPPAEVERARASGFVHGFKLYPAGATTHSDAGVTDVRHIDPVLARMAELGVVLQVHGEVTEESVDVFDREARFIDDVLAPLAARHPALRIVFEHITTRAAVDFVRSARDGIAATLTPQHLLHNRNAMFAGGIRPHFYCLPVLKTEPDRAALLEAATSGDPRFFLGTDSAPHARHTKENSCGCAGMYSAHAGLELYAEAFDAAGALDRLDGFAHRFGADFYRLPRNAGTVTLWRRPTAVPASFVFGDAELVPMRAGGQLAWTLRRDPMPATR